MSELNDLKNKIQIQNKNIEEITKKSLKEQEELSNLLSNEIQTFKECLSRVQKINPYSSTNPLAIGLESKIQEFVRSIEQNNEKIKKNNENIPEIQRKKKENDDFFKKFIGEKKVWLDRLLEEPFRDLAYEKGFKYFYEAKTIKLLMEGILLEKVQDRIEKELTEKGEIYGWDIMNEAKILEERKKEELELNIELLKVSDPHEALNKENETKNKWESEDEQNKKKKEEITLLWKQLWGELWLPKVPINNDENIKNQRDLMKKITMEVTFEMYQKVLFDVWKFKNIINNAEEYVIMDKVRKYFPDDPSNPNKDEAILNKMMNMIEEIKSEEEIIYCDLKPAKETLNKYRQETSKENASIERLENLINKIEDLHSRLNEDSTLLIKSEIEEINSLIKEIPDDKEKKLFKDNLLDESRLYDIFLPLTNLLMVVSYISIGNKRTRNYQNKLDKINEENDSMKSNIKEMEGKLKMLKDVKDKNQSDFQISTTVGGQRNDEINEEEIEQCKKAKSELNDYFNYIQSNKDMIKNNQINYSESIKKFLVDDI